MPWLPWVPLSNCAQGGGSHAFSAAFKSDPHVHYHWISSLPPSAPSSSDLLCSFLSANIEILKCPSLNVHYENTLPFNWLNNFVRGFTVCPKDSPRHVNIHLAEKTEKFQGRQKNNLTSLHDPGKPRDMVAYWKPYGIDIEVFFFSQTEKIIWWESILNLIAFGHIRTHCNLV